MCFMLIETKYQKKLLKKHTYFTVFEKSNVLCLDFVILRLNSNKVGFGFQGRRWAPSHSGDLGTAKTHLCFCVFGVWLLA